MQTLFREHFVGDGTRCVSMLTDTLSMMTYARKYSERKQPKRSTSLKINFIYQKVLLRLRPKTVPTTLIKNTTQSKQWIGYYNREYTHESNEKDILGTMMIIGKSDVIRAIVMYKREKNIIHIYTVKNKHKDRQKE